MLPRGLIVSCQAYEGDPLFGPHIMAAMACAAQQGGAVAIRANGPADIAAIRAAVSLPIIGLWKIGPTGLHDVYITPDAPATESIAAAGCSIIAIDATPRKRAGEIDLRSLIDYLNDALQAVELGADVVSTTLAGYTAHGRPPMEEPDLPLLGAVLSRVRVPVVAEGRFATPAQVAAAFDLGAHAVVVGAAITRPEQITARFVRAYVTRIHSGP